MSDQDAREATIREALTRASSPIEFEEGRQQWVDEALAALASLARDARKAALADTVVEAAEGYIFLGHTRVGYDVAHAAYRAEFPATAEPQEAT